MYNPKLHVFHTVMLLCEISRHKGGGLFYFPTVAFLSCFYICVKITVWAMSVSSLKYLVLVCQGQEDGMHSGSEFYTQSFESSAQGCFTFTQVNPQKYNNMKCFCCESDVNAFYCLIISNIFAIISTYLLIGVIRGIQKIQLNFALRCKNRLCRGSAVLPCAPKFKICLGSQQELVCVFYLNIFLKIINTV